MKEIQLHTSEESLWIVIDKKVYDVTRYGDHPGGKRILITNAGKDATSQFMAIHSEYVLEMLKQFHIGQVIEDLTAMEAPQGETMNRTSSTRNTIPFVLQDKIRLSHNSYRLVMKSAGINSQSFPLPVGKHVLFHFKNGDQVFTRPYTPIVYNSETGDMEVVIKTYPIVEGKISSSPFIESAKVGDFFKIEGPKGRITYSRPGILSYDDMELKVRRLVFLCGGTGIAPVHRVIVSVLNNDMDGTEIELLYSNHSEEDILLRNDLDALMHGSNGRLKTHYILTSPPESGWNHPVGRISDVMVKTYVAAPDVETLALLCGPHGFEESCVSALLANGYDAERVFRF